MKGENVIKVPNWIMGIIIAVNVMMTIFMLSTII